MASSPSSTTLHAVAVPSIDTSNYIYVKSVEHSWVPAKLLERHSSSDADENNNKDKNKAALKLFATVSIPQYKDEAAIQSDAGRTAKKHEKQVINLNSSEYANQSFPLQNVDENGQLKEVEDMVDLPFLHEVRVGTSG